MYFQKILYVNIYKAMLMCMVISGTSHCLASDITEPELLESIKIRDQIIKADVYMTAKFNVLTQAVESDPEQGLLVKKCHVVWKKNETNMKVIYDYLKDPVYSPPDSEIYQSIDYDANKRLIIWRLVEKYIMSTSEKTEIFDKTQLLYVSPNGDIQKSGGYHTTRHVFPDGGKYDGNYEFEQFFLASGLSFSDYIDPNESPEMEILDGNVILLNARGTFGKNMKGTWKLTVDPDFGFFIRKAVFTGEGLHKPSVELSISEIVKTGALEYARQSQLTLGRFAVRDYVDIHVSMGDNLELRQEVNRQMKALLVPGSEIIRFNGEKPTRTTVK